MSIVLAFLPSILSVIVILMMIPLGVTRTQVMFSVTVLAGLIVAAYKYLEGYRMYNLPLVGTAVVFAAFGLYRTFVKKD
ncbi:MAG: hypothetical protein K5772_01150 [Clostridia bacterium]|nr:hypothetical protein [Clostridia bacterium]